MDTVRLSSTLDDVVFFFFFFFFVVTFVFGLIYFLPLLMYPVFYHRCYWLSYRCGDFFPNFSSSFYIFTTFPFITILINIITLLINSSFCSSFLNHLRFYPHNHHHHHHHLKDHHHHSYHLSILLLPAIFLSVVPFAYSRPRPLILKLTKIFTMPKNYCHP